MELVRLEKELHNIAKVSGKGIGTTAGFGGLQSHPTDLNNRIIGGPLSGTYGGGGYSAANAAANTAAYGNMYGTAKNLALAGFEIGAGFVPGLGEAQDIAVLFDSSFSGWERGFAAASLAANVLTAGVLPNAGSFIRAARRFCSFDGDTQVATDDGFLKISEIKPGEQKVLARDEHTGEMSYQAVLDTYWNPYRQTVYITIRDMGTGHRQTIISNRIHPFYVGDVGVDLKLTAKRIWKI